MIKKAVAVTASALAFGAISMPAAAQGNPALGALIGGGVGAAIGQSVNGRNGALNEILLCRRDLFRRDGLRRQCQMYGNPFRGCLLRCVAG